MIYKSFRWPLILRFLLSTGFTAGTVFFFTQGKWVISITGLLALLISGIELIHYFNSINRKISFFFDAVRNEDSTLHFSEKTDDQGTKKLHSSLNQINTLISEIKIRNEHNERFFRELLKYSATGIITVDDQGYIDLANDAALHFTGLKYLAHINLLKQKNAALYKCFTALKPGQSQMIKLLNGEEIRQLSVKASRLQFGDKWFLIYSLYDIKAELDENELDTWQKLIRILTHEIMNSVAPITSLSNTLAKIVKSGESLSVSSLTSEDIEKTIEGLTVIEETGKGLMHFIDNYRKLTKIPKPVFKTIPVEEWLNRVDCLMREKISREEIGFEMIFKNKQKGIIGDEKLLTQVLINIINNAIEAVRKTEKKQVQLLVSEDRRGKLKISITDTGEGIKADEMDKIFIPFYTTKENGSGIGLSLSRQIMRLHKGTITAGSVPGKLTTFSLRF
jgi:two-component system, NtrC family, nitrogen regulation sensor histidine kinase NtrY